MCVTDTATALTLWRTADRLTRGSLLLAIASAVANIATYVGLSSSHARWPYLLHVSLMILGFWVFLRTGAHLCRSLFGRRTDSVSWDRLLVFCTVAAIAYLVLLISVHLSTWGEGGAIERHGRYFWQSNGSMVRELTESEYTRFALAIATWNHNLLHRRSQAL